MRSGLVSILDSILRSLDLMCLEAFDVEAELRIDTCQPADRSWVGAKSVPWLDKHLVGLLPVAATSNANERRRLSRGATQGTLHL